MRWATAPSAPRHMLDGLIQALGITKERFASPLDMHHSVTHYNSANPRDAVFGAEGDAFGAPWTGWSWGHPPHCPAALDKAVAWAAASARSAQAQDVPSATLLMLPRVGTAPPHMQGLGLNADVATHLGTIRGGQAAPCMHVLPAGWWAGRGARSCAAALGGGRGHGACMERNGPRRHGPPRGSSEGGSEAARTPRAAHVGSNSIRSWRTSR